MIRMFLRLFLSIYFSVTYLLLLFYCPYNFNRLSEISLVIFLQSYLFLFVKTLFPFLSFYVVSVFYVFS